VEHSSLLGTRDYTAPEYLQGYTGTNRSDIYSLGIIAYELLTGRLPYGENLSARKLRQVRYTPAMQFNPEVPAWLDGALEKAVQRDPRKRYRALSEFVYDLSHPNPALAKAEPAPLLERNPLGFWRGLAIMLLITNLLLLVYLATEVPT